MNDSAKWQLNHSPQVALDLILTVLQSVGVPRKSNFTANTVYLG